MRDSPELGRSPTRAHDKNSRRNPDNPPVPAGGPSCQEASPRTRTDAFRSPPRLLATTVIRRGGEADWSAHKLVSPGRVSRVIPVRPVSRTPPRQSDSRPRATPWPTPPPGAWFGCRMARNLPPQTPPVAELADLVPLIQGTPGFDAVVEELAKGASAQIDGAWGGAAALACAALLRSPTAPPPAPHPGTWNPLDRSLGRDPRPASSGCHSRRHRPPTGLAGGPAKAGRCR
jgi:hypothetical protein